MIPLYKPYMPDHPLLDQILASGQLAYGEYSREFERRLGEYIGEHKVLATNSFNMSIAVVISVLGINPGDEIIVSPMACLASTQPYSTNGIKVKWADIDPHTGTLDPDSVRATIDSKTKAIVHNHFCGYPGYIDEINEIGREHGIPVIDDGIEAFGSRYKGKTIGNCGTDITIFSFQAVRVPNTIDGGAVFFKDETLYSKARLVRDCGIDRSIFRDEIGEINKNCDITLRGHSATISNVNSYLGICQMDHLDVLLNSQRNAADYWMETLKYDKGIDIIGREDIAPNYWVFGTLTDKKREKIEEYRQKGWYASGVHTNNSIYSVFGNKPMLPGVEEFDSRFMALPSGWWVEECIRNDGR